MVINILQIEPRTRREQRTEQNERGEDEGPTNNEEAPPECSIQ